MEKPELQEITSILENPTYKENLNQNNYFMENHLSTIYNLLNYMDEHGIVDENPYLQVYNLYGAFRDHVYSLPKAGHFYPKKGEEFIQDEFEQHNLNVTKLYNRFRFIGEHIHKLYVGTIGQTAEKIKKSREELPFYTIDENGLISEQYSLE